MFMGQVYTSVLTTHEQQALHAMCHPLAPPLP